MRPQSRQRSWLWFLPIVLALAAGRLVAAVRFAAGEEPEVMTFTSHPAAD